MAVQPSFIDVAREGQGTLGRYLAGAVLIVVIWLGIGGSLSVVPAAIFLDDTPDVTVREAITRGEGLSATERYLVNNVPFPFLFVGTALVVRWLLRRSPRTLVTARPPIDVRRIAQGFVLWFLFVALGTFIPALVEGDLAVALEPERFVLFTLVALIVTPVQTTAEELFFRGYVIQGGSLISRRPLFLVLLSSVLFMLPHLSNPETGRGFLVAALFYLVVGAFLALISLRDGTLELAIGAHAANNLFGVLVVNDPEGALPAPAIFTSTTAADPAISLVGALVAAVLFYLVVFRPWARRARSVDPLPAEPALAAPHEES